jgi:hypothetical protein
MIKAREGRCRRFLIRWFVHSASTFLLAEGGMNPPAGALAPPAFTGFFTTTRALTPGRRVLRTVSGIEHPAVPPRCSLLHVVRPSGHSVSNYNLPSLSRGSDSWTGLTAGTGFPRPHHENRDHRVTWASPIASRLATAGRRIEFA